MEQLIEQVFVLGGATHLFSSSFTIMGKAFWQACPGIYKLIPLVVHLP
jgi:hypothetical protein